MSEARFLPDTAEIRMEIVAAVKHNQKTTDAIINQVWCRAGLLMYSDVVIVDTITDDFTIEQYTSTVESCAFDLHWENL